MEITWAEFVAAVDAALKEHGADGKSTQIEYMDFSWAARASDIHIVVVKNEDGTARLTAGN